MYVVIITGWRAATAERHGRYIRAALGSVYGLGLAKVQLRHGACKYGGVDQIAADIGAEWGWEIDPHPAQEVGGRILGPERNKRMCQLGGDEVLAFPGPGSTGTWDCLKWAHRYNIPFRGFPLQI